jgi:small-conductance mechanosensitive channel
VTLPGGLFPSLASIWQSLADLSQTLKLDVGDLVQKGLKIVAVLLLGWVAKRVLHVLTRRIERAADDGDPTTTTAAEQRGRTLAQLLNSVGTIAIAIAVALMILNLFVAIGPLLAGVGVAGLAISFGAQSLVKDVISGFFILLENQFAIDDIVTINDIGGRVERMTLRVVMLRDLSGVLHVIPNGSINVVSNRTRGFSRAVVDVGVAYHEQIDRVIEVMLDIGRRMWEDADWRARLVEEPSVLGVDELADSAVNVRMVLTTQPGKQFEVGRELRRRVKNRFDEEGITIPFPQRTLHVGDADALIQALGGRAGTRPQP